MGMNSTPFAILIGLAILHVALMEWVYPYRRYMQRKARHVEHVIKSFNWECKL